MEITIDVSEKTPVFSQLIEQVKAAVQSGHLKTGDFLPPIRQLASDLQINPNTVAKAYRLLERDSVIQTQGRRGTVVHPQAKANCKVDLNEMAFEQLQECIEKLRDSGLTDSELRNVFNRAMNNLEKNNQKD